MADIRKSVKRFTARYAAQKAAAYLCLFLVAVMASDLRARADECPGIYSFASPNVSKDEAKQSLQNVVSNPKNVVAIFSVIESKYIGDFKYTLDDDTYGKEDSVENIFILKVQFIRNYSKNDENNQFAYILYRSKYIFFDKIKLITDDLFKGKHIFMYGDTYSHFLKIISKDKEFHLNLRRLIILVKKQKCVDQNKISYVFHFCNGQIITPEEECYLINKLE